MDYKDLMGPDGEESNMGGTSQFIYFARYADIESFSAPAAAPASPFIMKTPFTMKTGKKFFQLYTTVDTSELETGSNGEVDGKSFKPTLKIFYPGASSDAIDFINRVKNDRLILIVTLPDGKMIQMGEQRFVVYANPNFKTTNTSGRGRGTEIELWCFQPNILVYDAAVPLTPAA